MFGDLNTFSVLAYCLQRTSGFLYFPINIEYKFGEKKQLRHFFHTFSEVHFVAFSQYRKNATEEDSTLKFPQLGFSGVK